MVAHPPGVLGGLGYVNQAQLHCPHHILVFVGLGLEGDLTFRMYDLPMSTAMCVPCSGNHVHSAQACLASSVSTPCTLCTSSIKSLVT
jgi:hypothetical protein